MPLYACVPTLQWIYRWRSLTSIQPSWMWMLPLQQPSASRSQSTSTSAATLHVSQACPCKSLQHNIPDPCLKLLYAQQEVLPGSNLLSKSLIARECSFSGRIMKGLCKDTLSRFERRSASCMSDSTCIRPLDRLLYGESSRARLRFQYMCGIYTPPVPILAVCSEEHEPGQASTAAVVAGG